MIVKSSNKFKILLLSSDTFKPFRPDVKILFATKITGKGHQIDWILQSESKCKKSYATSWLGNRIFVGRTINGPGVIDRLLKHLLALMNEFKIFKLGLKNNYDFILVKDKYLPALLALIVSKLYHIKFIFWLSYPFPEARLYKAKTKVARYPAIYKIRGVLNHFFQYKIIMRFVHHIFVQSDQMKQDIIAMKIPSLKMTPIPMGVEVESVTRAMQSLKPVKEENRILYLGTMALERHPEFLLNVHKIVFEAIPNALLYMVGDDDNPKVLPLLKKKARELGIEKYVRFTGFIPRKKAWELIRKANVCVSPFYPTFILNSTSPTKLVEYMALSKPVVASMHPEQQLIITQSKCGICTPWNEKKFARAIIKILNDPATAEQMGKSGRDYIKKHRTYDILADKVIATLSTISSRETR